MTRLSKWYITPPEDTERVKMEADINRIIILRDKNHTNFVEVIYYYLFIKNFDYFKSLIITKKISVSNDKNNLQKICWVIFCIRSGYK